MSTTTKSLVSSSSSEDDNDQLRRGPWTVEEDTLLIQYISRNGEGRWNLLAKRSGLRRTGKSCRLRWLNYLKPDVKRGNLSPKEQLMILDLHSKWGNRWSKIAQYLPGRTDNEIKNYWRTRVQKQARQLKIDTNSTQFQNIIRCFWMPRLLQKIEAGESASVSSAMLIENPTNSHPPPAEAASRPQNPGQGGVDMRGAIYNVDVQKQSNIETEYSCILGSEAMEMSKMSQFPECPSASAFEAMVGNDDNSYGLEALNLQGSVAAASSPVVFSGNSGADNCYVAETNWVENDFSCNMWNMDELWPIRY